MYLSRITHHKYHGLWVGYSKLIMVAAASGALYGFLSGPFKGKMYDQTDKSLYWKQSTHRFLKMTSTEALDKNTKTLILVFRCWVAKTNGKSLRKSFEAMNEMFIFNNFCI